ncbi:hypothetical protein D3C87_2185320 [compost metagenome]
MRMQRLRLNGEQALEAPCIGHDPLPHQAETPTRQRQEHERDEQCDEQDQNRGQRGRHPAA